MEGITHLGRSSPNNAVVAPVVTTRSLRQTCGQTWKKFKFFRIHILSSNGIAAYVFLKISTNELNYR